MVVISAFVDAADKELDGIICKIATAMVAGMDLVWLCRRKMLPAAWPDFINLD